MKDFKSYLKAYDGDEITAERVFKENSQLQTDPFKRVCYSFIFRNKQYKVYCDIKAGLKLVVYLGQYIGINKLIEKGQLKAYSLKEFLSLNGGLSFYFKEQLQFIKNIEVY